jgi:hypothetical protein
MARPSRRRYLEGQMKPLASASLDNGPAPIPTIVPTILAEAKMTKQGLKDLNGLGPQRKRTRPDYQPQLGQGVGTPNVETAAGTAAPAEALPAPVEAT